MGRGSETLLQIGGNSNDLIQRFYLYIAGFDCRHQIVTTKVDPRTVKVNIFIMDVDPLHVYSNEAKKAN